MKAVHESAEASLSDNPVIKQHIGMIKDLDPNHSEFDAEKCLSYMIDGTRGSGKVRFRFKPSSDPPVIESGILEMSTGESYELVPSSRSFETFDFNRTKP